MNKYDFYKEQRERLEQFKTEVEIFTRRHEHIKGAIKFRVAVPSPFPGDAENAEQLRFSMCADIEKRPSAHNPTANEILKSLANGRPIQPYERLNSKKNYGLDRYFCEFFAQAVESKIPQLLEVAENLAKISLNKARMDAKIDAAKALDEARRVLDDD